MDTGIGGKYTFSDGTPTHICIHFIFIAINSSGLHFPSNDIGLSSLKFFWWAPEFLFTSTRGRFSRSRSSKVDKFGANRKRICEFLLVCNSNFGPILHRFWARACFMCSWPHPYSTLIWGCSRCTRSSMLGVNERMNLKLFGREIIFEEFQPMWSWYLIVTDRQIDRRTDRRLTVASPRSALASRSKHYSFIDWEPVDKDWIRRISDSWGESVLGPMKVRCRCAI